MNKALFLDRDGVINHDYGYVHKIEDFNFVDGIFDLCEYFQKNGYLIVIISNQAGVSKGYFSINDLNKLTNHMVSAFLKHNIKITDILYETSLSEENYRRKPNPGMIEEAKLKYQIDLSQSILIGDKMSDLISGKRAGIETLYFFKGKYDQQEVNFDYNLVFSLDQIYKESGVEK